MLSTRTSTGGIPVGANVAWSSAVAQIVYTGVSWRCPCSFCSPRVYVRTLRQICRVRACMVRVVCGAVGRVVIFESFMNSGGRTAHDGNLPDWDTSGATNMKTMFASHGFSHRFKGPTLDLAKWVSATALSHRGRGCPPTFFFFTRTRTRRSRIIAHHYP